MAEAYYSSDEEVAWGPVQLREIKKHLIKPTKPPNHRFSEFYDWNKYDTESNDTVSSSDYHSTVEEIKMCSDIESLAVDELREKQNTIDRESATEYTNKESYGEEYNSTYNQNESGIIVISDDSDYDDEDNNLLKTEQSSTSITSEDIKPTSQSEDLSNSVNNSSINNVSDDFNDTIEEMELFLKHQKTISKSNNNSTIQTPTKTEFSIPVSSSTHLNQFKTPTLLNTQTNPQIVNSKRFKNVISPVALYIKSSRPCLKTTIHAKSTTKPIHTKPNFSNNCKLSTHDDTISELPEIVYKPKGKTIVVSNEEVNLPTSYKKMIKSAKVTHHESKCDVQNQSDIKTKLCDSDLSILPNIDDEISFVSTKKPFLY